MTPNAVRAAVAPAPAIRTPWIRIKRVLPFLGSAFVASVAYMDPGNLRDQHPGGRRLRLHAPVGARRLSNLMAILIQSLSAKLGIASGLTLPQAIRANTTRRMRIGLWLAAEAAAMATDLAEFLEAAIGMQILFQASPAFSLRASHRGHFVRVACPCSALATCASSSRSWRSSRSSARPSSSRSSFRTPIPRGSCTACSFQGSS